LFAQIISPCQYNFYVSIKAYRVVWFRFSTYFILLNLTFVDVFLAINIKHPFWKKTHQTSISKHCWFLWTKT